MKAYLEFKTIRHYSYCGTYPEEEKVGTYLNIDIYARLADRDVNVKMELNETVDYELIYPMVKEICSGNNFLIENLCIEIVRRLKLKFDHVPAWKVSVCKENPLGTGTFHPVFTLVDEGYE
ncbi:MAG: dihydroneopterin aldolase [Flavobacteriales bacterium]|nr:dihydroneopterin aldolase [Flavobacteriales bacterium]